MTDDHSLGPRDETMLLYVDLHYHVLFGCNVMCNKAIIAYKSLLRVLFFFSNGDT